MIGVQRVLDIYNLNRQGHSIRTIADPAGVARSAVRKVLRREQERNVVEQYWRLATRYDTTAAIT
jgi:hypothetical protein